MNKIILLGFGGHAKSIIELLLSSRQYELVGLIGKPNELGKEILGFKCIGIDEDLESIKNLS